MKYEQGCQPGGICQLCLCVGILNSIIFLMGSKKFQGRLRTMRPVRISRGTADKHSHSPALRERLWRERGSGGTVYRTAKSTSNPFLGSFPNSPSPSQSLLPETWRSLHLRTESLHLKWFCIYDHSPRYTTAITLCPSGLLLNFCLRTDCLG